MGQDDSSISSGPFENHGIGRCLKANVANVEYINCRLQAS